MADLDPLETTALDPQAEADLRKHFENQATNDAQVWREFLGTKAGRSRFYRWLISGNIIGTPFVPGQTDSTFVNLGRQDFAKEIQVEASVAVPQLYLLALREGREEDRYIESLRKPRPEQPLRPEDQVPFDLPAPLGFPGHVPPAPKAPAAD